MFKITKIKKSEFHKKKYFRIDVYFSHEGIHEKDFHFGTLDTYYRAEVVFEREKYEAANGHLMKKNFARNREIEASDNVVDLNEKVDRPEHPRWVRTMQCLGEDNIEHLGDGKYHYWTHVNDCLIIQAAVRQLEQMKRDLEDGVGRFHLNPSAIGCFRSGDVLDDFVGILETFERFWD